MTHHESSFWSLDERKSGSSANKAEAEADAPSDSARLD